MKVLFVTYPHIGLGKGGMRVQIDRTAEGLRALGVEVEYYDPWADQIDDADVCHFFSSSLTMGYFFGRAADKGKPVVWSPVFNVFRYSALRLKVEIRCFSRIPGVLAGWKMVRMMGRRSAAVIALNRQEAARLSDSLPGLDRKLTIIPNGMDKFFADGDPNRFREKFGLDEYVLNVAYIGPVKNQLSLIRAMKGLPLSLVIIGQPVSGAEGYFQACKREAGDNVVFAGTFPYGDPLLLSAYAGAKVFALPSTSEVMTLSLMEAALAGCQLVASSQVPVVDYLRDYVATPNPHKLREIRAAISAAAVGERPCARDVMLAQPGWDDVGTEVLKVYERLLRR